MFYKIKLFTVTPLIFLLSVLFISPSFTNNTSNLPNLSFFLDMQQKTLQMQSIADTRQVVRVGYKENYGVIKVPAVEGYEGYGYEYINAIFSLLEDKYKLEYVLVEWSKGLEMLENGELDILAGANYTTERSKKFLFPKDVFCVDSLLVVALKNNQYLDVRDLEDSTICVQAGDALLPVFYDFLEKNQIHANIIETGFGSIHKEKQSHKYDFILTGSMQMDNELNVIANIAAAATYLMFNKDQIELLEDVNNATDELTTKDHLLKQRLFLKYFDNAITQESRISKEEYNLLQDQESYTMGVLDLNSPYSYTDSRGKLQGTVVDVMQQLSDLGGVKFNIIKIDKQTPKEVLQDLELTFVSQKDEAKYNLPKSTPIIRYPYVVIESNVDLPSEILGTADYYNLDINDLNFFIPNQTLQEFSSVTKLIRAFNDGKVHNIILSSSIFTQHFSEVQRRDYTTRNINYWYSPSISYSPLFPEEKIHIIDKLLAQLNKFAIENNVAKHTTILASKDEFYYLKQYKYELALLALVILLIFYRIYKRLQIKKEEEIQNIENYDKLTGLFSFSRFQAEVRQVIDSDDDNNTEFSIVSANIDNFRYINEMHGFHIGDEVLKHVANHIQQNMTEPLPLAAQADNFLILVKKEKLSNKTSMSLRVEELNHELEKYLGETYTLSFSVGVYHIHDKSIDLSLMIDFANIARNRSKASFGTTIEVYTDAMKNAYLEKTEVLANVRYAFEHKEFQLFYQPKFDIANMNIVGAEALIRWFKDGKIVPPDSFIPIIENNNLIDQLDYYVMEMACTFIQEHDYLNLPTISINLSGHTIIREDVVLKLIQIAEDHGISPDKLDLEITESALVDNFHLALENINVLRKEGFTVSMDDFGAGISSLNRLHTIPIDILKIDRGFIVHALDDPKGAAIIKNVINLARDINVQTVAEGIETIEQLEFLRNLSCNVGQGYFFSRPVPEKEFIAALQRDRDNNTSLF